MRRSMFMPIPQIFDVARNLEAAVRTHLDGRTDEARSLFTMADDVAVRRYNDHAMGAGWCNRHHFNVVANGLPRLEKTDRPRPRMPTAETEAALLERDGLACRFCGVPLVYPAVRKAACALYPDVVRWGLASEDHAGFKALWLQFDHLVPNSRGGESTLENMVVTCAPCNYSRMDYTLEEAGIEDPRTLPPLRLWDGHGSWNGLIALLG